VLNDVRDDPRVTEPGPLERIGLRALVQVPLMERGRLTTVFFLGDDRPRSWTQGELDFIRAVFDRTYAA
ncbi:GAF domain-containing protein, partial [uncultured Jannaschia sp.]|uniref:GAF domain-containing protein n=1 Tax=uncultured Jannaschia sp. TaxID=293347 RepID=UPI003429165E